MVVAGHACELRRSLFLPGRVLRPQPVRVGPSGDRAGVGLGIEAIALGEGSPFEPSAQRQGPVGLVAELDTAWSYVGLAIHGHRYLAIDTARCCATWHARCRQGLRG